jgi:hypothetical protein
MRIPRLANPPAGVCLLSEFFPSKQLNSSPSTPPSREPIAGRITSIHSSVVFGAEEEVEKKLAEAGCYTSISTAHVERDDLTSRQTSSRFARKASRSECRWRSRDATLNSTIWSTISQDTTTRYGRISRSLSQQWGGWHT